MEPTVVTRILVVFGADLTKKDLTEVGADWRRASLAVGGVAVRRES